jgi:hypothetical protein
MICEKCHKRESMEGYFVCQSCMIKLTPKKSRDLTLAIMEHTGILDYIEYEKHLEKAITFFKKHGDMRLLFNGNHEGILMLQKILPVKPGTCLWNLKRCSLEDIFDQPMETIKAFDNQIKSLQPLL